MALVLDLQPKSLTRWQRRRQRPRSSRRRGRREVIPVQTRWLLRICYLEHHRQWGPSVLAAWALRTGLGRFSPSTISRAIDDLKPKRQPKPKPRRYQVTAPDVMWSEDGMGFRERGQKWELLALGDEHSRHQLNHRLVKGPAKSDDVVAYLEEAFEQHGPPLVLKQDLGSNLNAEQVLRLCERHGVLVLNSPAGYPPYNGRRERANRDIRQYVHAMRRDGPYRPLAVRVDAAINDVTNERPRPVLGGRTAREVYESEKQPLPNRWQLIKEVNAVERRIKRQAKDRAELDSARRRAIESVLSSYRLMNYRPDAETNFSTARVTA